MSHVSSSRAEKIAVLLLFVVAIAWRLITGFSGETHWLPNFAPLAAIALCGAIYFPRKLALALPLAAMFVSDLILNAHYGVALLSVEMLARYAALALIGGLGLLLRARPRFVLILLGSLAGSAIFYIVTNAASWLGNPAYSQTAAGLGRALTVGQPGYPPAWMFFRNTLASDLLFTALFCACLAATRARSETFPNAAAAAR